jgi:hypothetical protein
VTELELSWDLTPTERRIAETAFARSNIDFDPMARAYDAAMAVRALRGDIRDRKVSLMEREKMLEELRREPEQKRWDANAQMRIDDLTLRTQTISARFDRMRNALHALVKEVTTGVVAVPGPGTPLGDALHDAREAVLGR